MGLYHNSHSQGLALLEIISKRRASVLALPGVSPDEATSHISSDEHESPRSAEVDVCAMLVLIAQSDNGGEEDSSADDSDDVSRVRLFCVTVQILGGGKASKRLDGGILRTLPPNASDQDKRNLRMDNQVSLGDLRLLTLLAARRRFPPPARARSPDSLDVARKWR